MTLANRKRIIAGNWKMNGLSTDLAEIQGIAENAHGLPRSVDVVLCLPATLIARTAQMLPVVDRLQLGGQDCHADRSGAHTGDVSADMLSDAGASHVIVGHSERRASHGESDADVCAKARAALAVALVPIICVGESLADREAGHAEDVVARQVAGSVPADAPADALAVAYEPIWAIGTGLTPSLDDIARMHAVIRATLAKTVTGGEAAPILYGGSVKPGNAADILAVEGVDGALVGGASLKAADFNAVIGHTPA